MPCSKATTGHETERFGRRPRRGRDATSAAADRDKKKRADQPRAPGPSPPGRSALSLTLAGPRRTECFRSVARCNEVGPWVSMLYIRSVQGLDAMTDQLDKPDPPEDVTEPTKHPNAGQLITVDGTSRSEEHTSDSSHITTSYAVFCL